MHPVSRDSTYNLKACINHDEIAKVELNIPPGLQGDLLRDEFELTTTEALKDYDDG